MQQTVMTISPDIRRWLGDWMVRTLSFQINDSRVQFLDEMAVIIASKWQD